MDSLFKKTKLGYIPEEIIIEILSRCPVKTLLRFKSVCKPWKSLISDATFIRKHLSRMSLENSLSHHHLVFDDGSIDKPRAISIHSLLSYKDYASPVKPTRSALQVDTYQLGCGWIRSGGTCDGLILLISHRNLTLLLWNPSTRETKILPKTDKNNCDIYCYLFGFGHDHLSNDYKVVKIYCCGCERQREGRVWVYSLRTNIWRKIQDSPYKFFRLRRSILVGDNLVWFGRGMRALVSFNLVKETFQELALPRKAGGWPNLGPQLGVLNGKLCIVNTHRRCSKHMWVMGEYGVKESWSKRICFPFPEYVGKCNNYHLALPLCTLPNGEVLLHFGEGLVIYKKKTERSYRAVWFYNMEYFSVTQVYVESLISLNGNLQ